jgi:L-aspartate oxidase
MTDQVHFDGVLVIGAGLAGLTAALAAAPRRAMILTPTPLGDGCASSWAQGGLAAALADDDDPALHAADTIAAGAGLCDPDAADILTREGPAAVRALADLGAPFDRKADGGFIQSLEAAHSRARVARVGGDGAGLAIMRAVIARVRASAHIEIREGLRVVALLQDAAGDARGVLAESAGGLVEIRAAATILASGGLGGLYAVTTDPTAIRGEGLALAWLAGAEILDPEFVQFHPTAIDIGADPAPLATEALRGEGSRLVDAAGQPVVDHPAGDLAPRDVVARAIARRQAGGERVFLDTRAAVGAEFDRRFPAVFAACRAGGVDPRVEPIPVAPAAHYHMGGVATDSFGRTSVHYLFAAGEVAASCVHGANRLASNSLLEAVVFGRRAGEAARDVAVAKLPVLPALAAPQLPATILTELRHRMTADAGVERTGYGLAHLSDWIETQNRLHGPALPLVAASLVVQGALARRESRGAHYRADFPEIFETAAHTRLARADSQRTRAA